MGLRGGVVTELEARAPTWNHLFSELKTHRFLDRLSSSPFINEEDCVQSITSKYGSLEIIKS